MRGADGESALGVARVWLQTFSLCVSKLIPLLSSLRLRCGRCEDIEIPFFGLQLLFESLKLRVHDLVAMYHFGQFAFSNFEMLLKFQVFFFTASDS